MLGLGVVVLGLGVVVLALLAPSAGGDKTAPLYAKMEQRFTKSKPGMATGWRFNGALKPFPAGMQVPPQRSVDFVFPQGTRSRLGAVPSCLASDEQIAKEGLAVCPEASRVGSGEAELFFGTAGTLTVDVHVFVAQPELLAVFADESGAVLRVLRAVAKRRRVTATLPPVDAPGGYELAVTRFELKLQREGTRNRPFLQTPRTCPKNRRWKFTYLPRYDELYGVQRSTSSMRCRRDS
jgi:hypothetical protein